MDRWHTEGTPYTVEMLFFECRGGRYYAGQEGQVSRHPARDGSVRRDVAQVMLTGT